MSLQPLCGLTFCTYSDCLCSTLPVKTQWWLDFSASSPLFLLFLHQGSPSSLASPLPHPFLGRSQPFSSRLRYFSPPFHQERAHGDRPDFSPFPSSLLAHLHQGWRGGSRVHVEEVWPLWFSILFLPLLHLFYPLPREPPGWASDWVVSGEVVVASWVAEGNLHLCLKAHWKMSDLWHLALKGICWLFGWK